METKDIHVLLEKNFIDKVTYFPSKCPSMHVMKTRDGVVATNSLMPSDTFNIVALAEPKVPLSCATIKNIINMYQAQALPFAWWLGPSALASNLDRHLQDHGMSHSETEYGMALSSECIDTSKYTYHPNLQIREAQCRSEFTLFGEVLASVFEPFDVTAVSYYEKMSRYYEKNNHFKMFIGYYDGIPVSIASVIKSSGIGGIYDIVTHPDYQRRGIAKSMTQYCIEVLMSMRCHMIGLLASADGFLMYQKLGFQALEKVEVYSFI